MGKKNIIRIGVIGCGYWGPNLIRNLRQLPNVNLSVICDIDASRLKWAKTKYDNLEVTNSYIEVLESSQIDAIVIASPASTHYEITKACLLANKHVLVEKPLALTSQGCRDLIQLSEKRKRILMVGHTFEYNAAVNKLKEYLDNGDLGKIYYIYSQRLNLGRVRQDINALWNFAPHDISIILYWLTRQPVRVSAKGMSYLQEGIEDVVFMNLEFADGINAHIHISWLDPNKVRRMTVVGSKKMVVYDDVSINKKIQIYDKGITRATIDTSLGNFDSFSKFQFIQRAGELLIPKLDFVEPLKIECEHFIKCIQNGKKPLTDGFDGLRVVKVLESAQRSMENRGIPVEVETD